MRFLSLWVLPETVYYQLRSGGVQTLRFQMQDLLQLHSLPHMHGEHCVQWQKWNVRILVILRHHAQVPSRDRQSRRCRTALRLVMCTKLRRNFIIATAFIKHSSLPRVFPDTVLGGVQKLKPSSQSDNKQPDIHFELWWPAFGRSDHNQRYQFVLYQHLSDKVEL